MNRAERVFWGFFLALLVSASAYAQTSYVLRDTDCKLLSNNDRGEVETKMGDLSIGKCKKGAKALVCSYTNLAGKSLGDAQEYEIQYEQGGIVAAKSASGNIRLLIDTENGRYYYGMVYLVMEQGLMLTKNCTGTVKSR